MQPLIHFIVSTLLVLILWPFYGINSIWAYLTGFLVDIDHLIEYFLHHKELSYKKLKHFYATTDFNNIINPLHTIEFLILLIILSFYHKIFVILTISFAIHWSMDFIYQIKNKFMHHRNFSILLWLYQKKIKVRQQP